MIKDLIDFEGAIDDNFMVKSVVKNTASNGKEYLSIILQDVSGTIDAKKWEVHDEDKEIIIPGQVIGVKGHVAKFKMKPQIKIDSVYSIAEGMVDSSKYVMTAPFPIEELTKEVKNFIGMIKDPDIKAVTEGVLYDNWDQYITYPAAKSIHQAYQNGLIYHSLSVCKIGYAIACLYPDVFDTDYVIAGTLMHDIGKVQEFSGVIGTEYTRIGKLESHIHIGAMMVNQKCHELGISEEKTDLLTHIILSHHGIPEYGSAVVPHTPDAFLVHVADDTDAKADIMRNCLKDVKPGECTGKILAMDGIELYKKK